VGNKQCATRTVVQPLTTAELTAADPASGSQRVGSTQIFYHGETSSAPRKQWETSSAPREQWENKECAAQTVGKQAVRHAVAASNAHVRAYSLSLVSLWLLRELESDRIANYLFLVI